jgi:Tfp pilus assembly protein PilV
MNRLGRSARGVSLVEALVALAVMAFGMLALIGVQSTLRLNGDTAKQRSEAVRIAQSRIDDLRAFSVLPVTAGASAYADIVSAGPVAVVGTNATFQRTDTVVESTDPGARSRTLTVEVSWPDRTGENQVINLSSVIAGVSPELAGSLGLPMERSAPRQPGGRHGAVPVEAIIRSDGLTSEFAPPGGDGLRWVFNNSTGVITSICLPAETCTPTAALLLTGYVRFATGGTGQPTGADAENPTGALAPIGVQVAQTAPIAGTVECFEQAAIDALRYFCAVPVGTTLPQRWSGRAELAGLTLAASVADSNAGLKKVCRYTPVRDCQPAVGSMIWGAPGATATCTGAAPTPSRPMRNVDHPRNYVDVTGALTNQNFLVIDAGAGGVSYSCPGDDTGTGFVNGNTWHHQPHE